MIGKIICPHFYRNIEIRSVTKAFPVGSTAEFWESMVKGSAPIQMMKKGLGEVVWREKEKLALAWLEETLPALKRPLTSDAWLGGGSEVKTTIEPWSILDRLFLHHYRRKP